MSKVALSGNASGTGTFTIASPNGNTDYAEYLKWLAEGNEPLPADAQGE